MNFLRSLFVGAFLLVGASVSAAAVPNFNQDHMITTNYSVIVHSAFDNTDHITSYSDYGTFQWDVTMNTKVISMKMKDGLLYVFSGARSTFANKTYVTCIDPVSGIVIWERP